MGEPPQKKKRERKKKCGFIAASLGQGASGLSFPHHTIISWDLTAEKYGPETHTHTHRGREKAKDRDDGADVRRSGRDSGKIAASFSNSSPFTSSFCLFAFFAKLYRGRAAFPCSKCSFIVGNLIDLTSK